MLGNAPLRNEIFAGNRAIGRIALLGRGGDSAAAGARACMKQARCGCGFPNGNSTARARRRHRQYRRRHDRRRPLRHRHQGRRRRAADRHHRGGGENLSLARAGHGHRREARRRSRRRAGVAAAGDDPVRSGAAAPHASMSISPATPSCCWPKPSCSAAPPWAKPWLQGISSTAGACASAARWSSPRRSASTARSRNAWRNAPIAAGGVAVASVLKIPGDDDDCCRDPRHAGRFRRRSRHIGLEWPRGRAPGRARRRRVAPRSRRRAHRRSMPRRCRGCG